MISNILSRLPQASVIRPEDAERWLSRVVKWHGDRAEFHAMRIRGLGGSEIGAVIRGLNNIAESGFSSLEWVVQQKLMLRSPMRETVHTRRGIVLEDLARRAFFHRYGGEPANAAVRAMRSAEPRKGYEWLVGNPDDIVRMTSGFMVNDYKVPNCFSDEIPFDYDAQVHHYGLIAKTAGIPIRGGMITQLDLAPELADSLVARYQTMSPNDIDDFARLIAKTDMPGFRVVSHVVPVNREMQLDILDCGSHCWNEFVLKGVVPDTTQLPMPELGEPELLLVGRYQEQYAMAKSGITYLTAVADAAKASLAAALHGVDIADRQFPESMVNVSPEGIDGAAVINEALLRGATEEELQIRRDSYCVESLVAEIERLGGNPTRPDLFHHVTDATKAADYLTALGVSTDAFRLPGVSIRMSTKKVDKQKGLFLQEKAKHLLGSWLNGDAIAAAESDGSQAIESDDEAATGTLHDVFGEGSENPSSTSDASHNLPTATKSARLR